ncbi:membrane-associating domain-containing protein [Cryomyces antarcticus]|nr:hypothetical protein LTR04_002912 [Oleoguttula sp. CCFEE 6159]
MALNLTLPLRIVQALFALIMLGLTGYVAHWWSGWYHAYSPSQINFLLFTAIWTVFALLYLTLAPWKLPTAAHKFAILAAEALTMLFWFAGWVALAVFLSNRVCFGHVCSAAKAAAVFGAFEWLLFAATTVMAAMHVFRTRGTGTTKPDPNMEVHQGV